MSLCSTFIIFIALTGFLIIAFRKPSKGEIKKFKSKKQDQINWSNMGF